MRLRLECELELEYIEANIDSADCAGGPGLTRLSVIEKGKVRLSHIHIYT